MIQLLLFIKMTILKMKFLLFIMKAILKKQLRLNIIKVILRGGIVTIHNGVYSEEEFVDLLDEGYSEDEISTQFDVD